MDAVSLIPTAPSIDPSLLGPGGALSSRQDDFAALIARARSGERPESAARRAAEDFVAVALVQPILARVRASNRASAPFAPGQAERQFGAIADAQVARQIVRKGGYPLVDRLAHDLLKRTGKDTEVRT